MILKNFLLIKPVELKLISMADYILAYTTKKNLLNYPYDKLRINHVLKSIFSHFMVKLCHFGVEDVSFPVVRFHRFSRVLSPL